MNPYRRIRTVAGVLFFLFMLGSGFPGRAAATPADAAPKAVQQEAALPILMYHEVKNYRTGKDCITPSELESDLKYLQSSHYTAISMTDLINYVDGRGQLPEKPIVLSFDDGYLNNYIYVYPLIQQYHTKIVLSILGKNTDDFTRIPSDNLDYSHVTWWQINEMMGSGLVEIQNHTYNMHTITRKRFGCQRRRGESLEHYEQALTEDIGRLQERVQTITGAVPNTFTYPYGQVSSESLPVIRRMGFRASLTCQYGINMITKNPEGLYGLRRICRSHGVPARKAIADAMKTLKYRGKNR